jgi:tRNA A-37 threonylcarbamoyl transferase component Bud32
MIRAADPQHTSDPLAATEAASPASGRHADGSRPHVALLPPGTRLGRYVIEEPLGSGGMGAVYAARDPELRRRIAIKVLHSHLNDLQRRLRREGQAIAKLRHPNVVTIHDVGIEHDKLFIAMELIVGQTLRAYLEEPRSCRDVVAKLVSAARGLAAAHAGGLVHRDFKPDNVLLGDDGALVVTDFGLVDTLQESGRIDLSKLGSDAMVTQTGMFIGTPAYMAPEQFLGAELDARTDQFSFCVALWEGLYGKRPFEGSTLEELRANVLAGKLPRPPVRVPAFVHRAVARGLSLERSKRFPSMDALIAALSPRPWFRSRAVLAGGAAAVALAGGAAWAVAHHGGSPGFQLGAGRPLDRIDPLQRSSLALLHDGRVARVSPQGELAITSLGGGSRRVVRVPDGRRANDVAVASAAELVVTTKREPAGCDYWALGVDGNLSRQLTSDADCKTHVALASDHTTIAFARGGEVVVRDVAATTPRWTTARHNQVSHLSWSPNHARLEIGELGGTVIVDGATGSEVARFAPTIASVWFDDDRLLALGNAGFMRSELRLLELSPARESLVQVLDGQCGSLTTDGKGVLLTRTDQTSQAYVIPVTGDAPADIDAIAPLETESEMDFVTAGWTTSNEIVTLSLRGDDRAIVRTPLHGRGTTLAAHRGPASAAGVIHGEAFYMRNSDAENCELRAVDVLTATDRQVWNRPCNDTRYLMGCADRAGRCVVTGRAGPQWFDPATGQFLAPAPPFDFGDSISPDGTRSASATGDRVTIRSLIGDADVQITPTPAFVVGELVWADDQHWLVAGGPTEGDMRQIALLAADGSWRPVARSSNRELMFPRQSPDGSKLALTGRTSSITWMYFPIE